MAKTKQANDNINLGRVERHLSAPPKHNVFIPRLHMFLIFHLPFASCFSSFEFSFSSLHFSEMCRIAATNKNDEEPKLEWQDAATMGTPSLFEWPDMVSFSSAVFDAPCRAFLRDYLFSPPAFSVSKTVFLSETPLHTFSRPIFSRSGKATEPHGRRRSKPRSNAK